MKIDLPQNWTQKTILIVEDDVSNYLYLKAVLCNTRAHIIHARNGKEAIEIFVLHPCIDLILMDLIMPEMGGIMAANIISTYNKNVPIIAQSALLPIENNGSLGCFSAYLLKPFKPKELMAMISIHFNKNMSTKKDNDIALVPTKN